MKTLVRAVEILAQNIMGGEKDYGFDTHKVENALYEMFAEEARRNRAYSWTGDDQADPEGGFDFEVPYWHEGDVPNTNKDLLKLIDIYPKFDTFIKENAKTSFGDSSVYLPHADSNCPTGAVVLKYSGDSGDVEIQTSLGEIFSIAQKADSAVTPQNFAQWMLDTTNNVWKAEFNQSDIDAIGSESNLEQLAILAYLSVDTVVAYYVYLKDIKAFFRAAKLDRETKKQVNMILAGIETT